MDLEDAYRILEIDPGAGEEVAREARKLLAKVWHPDRHASDPKLQAKAQSKLADVNAAFERLEQAGFPPKPAPPPPPPKQAPPTPSPAAVVTPPAIEFVPNRRVRWPVIFVLAAALGIGAYVAIMKLGASEPKVAVIDAAVVVPDATVIVVADAAVPVLTAVDAGAVVRREKTFTVGSTRDEVIAAQGEPNGRKTHESIINGVRTASAQLRWGDSSTVDFDGDNKVIGWSEGDSPLHVRIEVGIPDAAARARAAGTFRVGSFADEVLGILGPPTRYTAKQWGYGTSTIDFAGTIVTGVTQGEPRLPFVP